MIILYVLLGILGLLLLLLLMPVWVFGGFEKELSVRVWYGPARLYKYPGKEKPEKHAVREVSKTKPKKEKKKSGASEKIEEINRLLKEDGLSATMEYFGVLLKLAGTAAERLLATVTVDRFDFKLSLCGEDTAETAILYGQACGMIYPGLAVLERWIRFKKRRVEVEPAFLAEETNVTAEVRLHVIPLRAVWVLARLAVRYIWLNMRMLKNPDKKAQHSIHDKPL
jgi:hypothetical protein